MPHKAHHKQHHGHHHSKKDAHGHSGDAPGPDLDPDGEAIDPAVRACMTSLRAWSEEPDTVATLSPADREFLSEHTLYRYARARKGDPEAALKLLRGTLEWRAKAVTAPLHCPRCPTDPTSHCFFPIGTTTDAHGQHPVVYGCPPRASNADVEVTLQHVIHQLEFLWAPPPTSTAAAAAASSSSSSSSSPSSAPAIPGAGCKGARWVWVVDFRGFGLTHAMQARLGIGFATIFANHFPERLHTLFLLNTPGVFSVLLAALRPFADERTMSKVRPLTGGTDALLKGLREDGGLRDHTLEWMRGVLTMDPVPGSVPPLPKDAHALQLPGIKLPGMD